MESYTKNNQKLMIKSFVPIILSVVNDHINANPGKEIDEELIKNCFLNEMSGSSTSTSTSSETGALCKYITTKGSKCKNYAIKNELCTRHYNLEQKHKNTSSTSVSSTNVEKILKGQQTLNEYKHVFDNVYFLDNDKNKFLLTKDNDEVNVFASLHGSRKIWVPVLIKNKKLLEQHNLSYEILKENDDRISLANEKIDQNGNLKTLKKEKITKTSESTESEKTESEKTESEKTERKSKVSKKSTSKPTSPSHILSKPNSVSELKNSSSKEEKEKEDEKEEEEKSLVEETKVKSINVKDSSTSLSAFQVDKKRSDKIVSLGKNTNSSLLDTQDKYGIKNLKAAKPQKKSLRSMIPTLETLDSSSDKEESFQSDQE